MSETSTTETPTTAPEPVAEPVAQTVAELLRAEAPDLAAIARRFDQQDLDGQIADMLRLGAKAQAKLFAVCAANEKLTLKDLYPEDAPPGGTLIWEGVNSLPLFRRFQKRVTPEGGRLAGYNEQAMQWITGPGCFTVRMTEAHEPTELVFDYTITPSHMPKGLIRIRPANRGLSRLVYGGMLDYMRRASGSVLIGRAWKSGKETPNYFLLARGAIL